MLQHGRQRVVAGVHLERERHHRGVRAAPLRGLRRGGLLVVGHGAQRDEVVQGGEERVELLHVLSQLLQHGAGREEF